MNDRTSFLQARRNREALAATVPDYIAVDPRDGRPRENDRFQASKKNGIFLLFLISLRCRTIATMKPLPHLVGGLIPGTLFLQGEDASGLLQGIIRRLRYSSTKKMFLNIEYLEELPCLRLQCLINVINNNSSRRRRNNSINKCTMSNSNNNCSPRSSTCSNLRHRFRFVSQDLHSLLHNNSSLSRLFMCLSNSSSNLKWSTFNNNNHCQCSRCLWYQGLPLRPLGCSFRTRTDH